MNVPLGFPLSRSESRSSNSSPMHIPLTNQEIEAVIHAATSTRNTPDGRAGPLPDTRTQLFVGNLPYRVRWQDLKDLFRKSGTVLRADVSLGPDNRSRGYGTVLMASADDAARSIEMFHGYTWQTRTLEVRPDRIPSDLDPSSFALSPPPLAPTLSSGSGIGILPMTAPLSRNPSGMSSISAGVVNLAERMEEFQLSRENSFSGSGSSGVGKNLFVGNLPFHCQWQDLKDLFRQAGTIIRADVAQDVNGRSRGFGTVSFASDSDAERAVNMFNGYEYNGRTLKVHHDKFTPSLALSMSSPGRSSFPSSPLDHIPSPFQLAHGSGHRPSPLSNVVQPDHSHYAGSYSFGPPSGPPTPYDHPLSAPPPMSPQRSLPPPSGPLHNQPAQALSSSVSPSRPSFADKAPAPLNLSGRSTSNSTGSSSKEQSGAHSSSTSPKNNFHPGPIALPPLRGNQISQAASGVSVSPLHHPAYSPHMGLPPITPSMPSFSFMPQNSTPQLHREFLSPGIGPYSPPLVDGGFWGRTPGAWVNPAPGAPLHAHSPMDSPANAPHDPAYSANMRRVNTEPGDYFPPVMPQEPPDYFPPMPPEQRDTGDDETSTATSHRGRPGSGFSDRSSDLGLGGPGKTSSIATSFDDAQELERRASGDGSKSDPKHTSPASLEVTGRTYSDGAPKPRSSTPAVSTPSKTDQQHIQGWDGTSTDLTFNHNQEFAKALGMPYGRRASWTPGTEKPPSLPQKNSDPVL